MLLREKKDLREPYMRREMEAVCDDCGELLLRCSECRNATTRRYCLHAIIFNSVVEWLCSDCIPKHNEANKSLESVTSQRQLRNTQFGSSITKEPNAEKEKATIRLHRNRHVDESTKHSPCGDKSNQGRNRTHKERRDAITTMQSIQSNEPEDTAIQENNAERTRHLVYEETVTPILKNRRPNPSMANANLVSNEGNSGEANRRLDEVLTSMIDMKMRRTRRLADEEIAAPILKNDRSNPSMANARLVFNNNSGEEDRISDGVLSSMIDKNMLRTRHLADEETATPVLKNRRSNPSMANASLVSNEGNSGETNIRSDEVLSSMIDEKMRRRMSVDREIVNSCNVHGITDPDSAQGDPDASIAGKTSYLGVKKMILKRVLQDEFINSELLPSKCVGPCESAKINPRKRKQSESYTPDRIKYQKASIINENKNVNATRSKSSRPAPLASLRDYLNMSRKDNGSSDKVIGHSKKGKNKKMNKSWLVRKASRGSRKTARVLQPSSLKRSSVEKSIPYSKIMDLALKESSFPLKVPRGSCAARVAEISSTTKELHDESKPKKGRRLILPYDEEEGGEALHVVDLNSRSCDNDGHVKQGECVENVAKNPRIYVGEDEEALRSGNLNHQKQMKKQRRIEANKDKNESLRNHNPRCAENNVSQLTLQTRVTKDHSGILRIPLVPESIGTQPLDKPYWTGILKIDKNYIPLSAHLSTKAGQEVQELSRSLPPIIKVTTFSTLKSCPKHLEAPIPSAGSVDLYFFCGDARPNKELEQVVKHVADSGIIIEAIVGLAKLCLFPSFVLPEEYQMFQGKPYLWGVFKSRKDEIKRLASVEQERTAHVAEEEHVQEQHVLNQQDMEHADTQDQVVHPEKQPLVGANREVGNEALSGNVLPLINMRALVSTNISSADHGQPSSNPEAPPLKLCGFVVARTPRSEQLLQEMQKEGALLFAVQQVVTEPGSQV